MRAPGRLSETVDAGEPGGLAVRLTLVLAQENGDWRMLDGPLHGYAISTRAAELSDGDVRLTAGTLYGALDRMTAPDTIGQPRFMRHPPRGEEAARGRQDRRRRGGAAA